MAEGGPDLGTGPLTTVRARRGGSGRHGVVGRAASYRCRSHRRPGTVASLLNPDGRRGVEDAGALVSTRRDTSRDATPRALGCVDRSSGGDADHSGPCSLPSGRIRTSAGYPEDAGVRVNHLRAEFGATNRPQQQEHGKSEERDAYHNTHQASLGEDQNCGADRYC
jgi:hypothetical protein